MAFKLEDLGYSYDALEPHFDAQTMEIHHTKHHKTYTDNLNNLIENDDNLSNKTIIEILKEIKENRNQKDSAALRNNAGGYFNHNLFWTILNPNGKSGNEPVGELAKKIVDTYSDFNQFKEKFSNAAKSRFGSGWAWLCVDKNKNINIISTANQDNPHMPFLSNGTLIPILGLDVWEHAYYLKFQNRRPDYINTFWNLVNWQVVEKNYTSSF